MESIQKQLYISGLCEHEHNLFIISLDSSIERSLSFGENNSNLNDSIGKDGAALDKAFSNINQTSEIKLKNKSAQNELNYTSIEKLAILKPQSKDYILCFDTSSLDHTSSVTSQENLAQTSSEPKSKDSSIEVGADSSKADGSKRTEGSDSGVDSARTLSPHVFNQIGKGHDIVLEDLKVVK